MAQELKIAVNDRDTAEQWLEIVEAINEDYKVAMEDAANVLKEMQQNADGTLIDEFVNLGDSLLTATHEVFTAISAIKQTVNAILNKVDEFKGAAVENIKGAVTRIFGK